MILQIWVWWYFVFWFRLLNYAGNLASIFYDQGKMDMAILNYKRAIACDAGFLEAYNNLVCSSTSRSNLISWNWFSLKIITIVDICSQPFSYRVMHWRMLVGLKKLVTAIVYVFWVIMPWIFQNYAFYLHSDKIKRVFFFPSSNAFLCNQLILKL